MYSYNQSEIEKDREAKGTNYCASAGVVYELASLVVGGLAMTPPAKEIPLSTPALRLHGQTYIFAINAAYVLHMAADGGNRSANNKNLVKHETLFHNADVWAAGEIQFREGIVVAINSLSGSYNTTGTDLLEYDWQFAAAVNRAFAQSGIRVSPELHAYLSSKELKR